AGASARVRAAAWASRPSCRIVAARPAPLPLKERVLTPSSGWSGAFIAWFTAWFMALIRLAFAAFVTSPAKPSEAGSPPRYAQQSTTFVCPSPNFRNLTGIWGVAAWSSHAERGAAMPLSIRHKLSRLPKRFPVGTTFVVEGRPVSANGKNHGQLRVFSRFVVLPGGRRIDLASDATTLPRSRPPRRSRRSDTPNAPTRAPSGSKKIVSERGTTLQQRR